MEVKEPGTGLVLPTIRPEGVKIHEPDALERCPGEIRDLVGFFAKGGHLKAKKAPESSQGVSRAVYDRVYEANGKLSLEVDALKLQNQNLRERVKNLENQISNFKMGM